LNGIAQNIPIDSCKPTQVIKVEAFVPSRLKDTSIIRGTSFEPQKRMDRASLENGFRVHLRDTTYKIISFRLGFYTKTGVYCEQLFRTDTLEPAKLGIRPYEQFLTATRMFIDDIRITRYNQCYWATSVIYPIIQ
jgi:hypothetical protein